eukprot:TRINITY_DN905_c0_g1_i4.p1 TRINITY_DN905_c0_g1~~TRINITY_DN905_c0_g1_i4.p1  ORF type:complete len:276 (-),score=57.65 TRINITY_DN905_c0_g1_i4:851-1678(-)
MVFPHEYRKRAFGWISYGVSFNLLNTIVYAALFPKLLESIVSKKAFSSTFSIVNAITTAISSVSLPFLGSLSDKGQIVKPMMVWAQYLGIVSTFFLVPADLFHEGHRGVEVVICMVAYVFAMMFLRTAVMGNNALLSKFQDTKRIKLSLLANAVGFSGNLGGLAVVAFCSTWIIPPRQMIGIRRECWWILIFVFIATIFALFMHLCPSDHEEEDEKIIHQEGMVKSGEKTLPIPMLDGDKPEPLKGKQLFHATFMGLKDTIQKLRHDELQVHHFR